MLISTASVAAWRRQIGQACVQRRKGGIVGMTLPIARDPGAQWHPQHDHRPGIFGTPMMFGMPKEVGLWQPACLPSRLGA